MKIVNESLSDFRLNKGMINEGKFISKFFKKVGKFFTGLFNGKPVEAQLPVNIALAQSNSSALSMMPSAEDKAMAPELSSITVDSILAKIEKQKADLSDKINQPIKSVSESYAKKLKKYHKKLNEAVGDKKYIPLGHPDSDVPDVNSKELELMIQRIIYFDENEEINPDTEERLKSNNLVIWGAPGIGKTEIVKAAIKKVGSSKRMITIQLQMMRGDEWFIPYVDKDQKGNIVYHDIKKGWLPAYIETGDEKQDRISNNFCNGGDEDNEGSGGLIFFDELSRADGDVQGSVMNLINEGIINEYVLGSKWVIISASNRPLDDPESDIRWSTALGDRVDQYNYIPDVESWSEWAMLKKINPAVINFLSFADSKMFYGLGIGERKKGPSPRSWARLSNTMAMVENRKKAGHLVYSESEVRAAFASSIGWTAVEQFLAFYKLLEQYPIESIKAIFTNPEKAPMPYKTGSSTLQTDTANALITTAITFMQRQKISPEEFANFCKYLVRLDNNKNGNNAGSIATMAYKMMISFHPHISPESGYGDVKKAKYKEGVDIFSNYYL